MIRRIVTPSEQSGERGIELSKPPYGRGLGVQLLAGVLLSLLAAALSFGLFYSVGNVLLDHTVYGESFSGKLSDRQFVQLQRYVTNEQITPKKLHRLNAWCSRGKGIYLAVYRDGTLIYESPAALDPAAASEESDPALENARREYTLRFSDGTTAQAFLYCFASDAFYLWMLGVSALMAFAVFSLCFVSLIHRKLRYIRKLKKELDILAGGDLSYPVTVQGQDELSELAVGIDEMRRSILTHQQAESEIRSANSQLVTAMSHDLRTPLTALMAYLEILDRDKARDEDQRRHLIRQSLAKTISIKSMVDKLFEYFLAYTSEWEQPDMERHKADELLQQFWQEYAFSLESQGFSVETSFPEIRGEVEVNIELLRRAFDNLYANLVKYAEPARSICIRYCRENSHVLLTLENAVSLCRDNKESTNIGLNTCDRILRMHGGTFKTKEEGGVYVVEIRLPLLND